MLTCPCHSREGRNPWPDMEVCITLVDVGCTGRPWIPAFAGMTSE